MDLSTFDTTENSEITSTTGELLFAVYSLTSVLVALNLLIAMLSNTFQTVAVMKRYIMIIAKSINDEIINRTGNLVSTETVCCVVDGKVKLKNVCQ